MKTLQEIAAECGLGENHTSLLYGIVIREKESDGGLFATTDQLVLAMYRHIESLHEKLEAYHDQLQADKWKEGE